MSSVVIDPKFATGPLLQRVRLIMGAADLQAPTTYVLRIVLWCADHAPDGNIERFLSTDIAGGIGWTRDIGVLRDVLDTIAPEGQLETELLGVRITGDPSGSRIGRERKGD